jgi:hypothetical protein
MNAGVSAEEGGVALVITLILLSVITFMAITFLVVSRGEKSTVGSVTEQTTARLAAEQAVEMAQNAMIVPFLAFTNSPNVRLLVSTNYINPLGFNTAPALRRFLTNVSYAYPNGAPLNNFNDVCQNIANLFYLARVPVFMTNRLFGSNQFSFYYDLNQNGRFDESGLVGQTNNQGQPILTGTNTFATNFVMGDPQWIGILERGNYTPGLYNLKIGRPMFPVGMAHSADNLFISRYAYIVIPTSAALDINHMHNYAKLNSIPMASDGFWRNQGVGTWEVNLAAFLADLNTNFWNNQAAPYVYDKSYPGFLANRGTAFDDAVALLRFRYSRTYRPPPNGKLLNSIQSGFPGFGYDFVDEYASGETVGAWPAANQDYDVSPFNRTNLAGWWGSDNPSNFFDMQELYDRTKSVPAAAGPGQLQFCDRLRQAGTNVDSYDRYTFYRLLEQLSTDSAPERPKLNLNFADVDAGGNIVANLATNLTPWQPVQFFTNAVAQMLADGGYGTNIVDYVGGLPRIHIQIYPTNYYSPSVHRYLQLAANIYDASTNRAFNIADATNGFPSVFRPIFFDENGTKTGSGSNVWIIGYTEVTNIDVSLVATNVNQLRPFHDLNDPGDRRPVRPTDMVYGVPLVIGAKKGFPNFNEFGLLQDINVTRNLIFHRSGTALTTNQVYTMGISNVFAIEAWNSYGTPYPRNLELVAVADVITTVSNEAGICRDQNNNLLSVTSSFPVVTNILTSTWKGYAGPQSRQSFVFPLGARSYLFLTNSDFAFNLNRFLPSSQTPLDPPNNFPVPHWKVMLRPRVRFALIDLDAQRIIDYVNISEQQEPVDVAKLLQGTDNGGDARCDGNFNNEMGSFFCTNRVAGNNLDTHAATYGIVNQFGVSIGSVQVSDAFWRNFNPQMPDRQPSIEKFRSRILGTDTISSFAAPFVPRRVIHHSISWQANDPLVHYVAGDLQDPMTGKRKISYDTDGRGGISVTDNPLVGFPLAGQNTTSPLNQHFRPWGGNPNHQGDSAPPTAKRIELKDSMIKVSDNWSFMTNKFPNVGWLGRVHRGTPWQTLFLKSAPIDFPTWTNWVGNNFMLMNYDDRGSSNYDAVFSMPTNDFRVLDMFTTAFNENASKGQLSVDQTNIAAWSAILSGVIVNLGATNFGQTNLPVFIEPAGVYNPFGPTNSLPPLVQIVNGINRTRSNTTNNPTGSFAGRGDILSVPELTVGSPYLQGANPDFTPDWVYERIPQQVMGLLRGGDEPPRFVIYAFGQALKPAEHSLVTASGPFFGLCTNYQVTAESVIRAVVRVDNAPTPRAPNNIPRVYVESFNVLAPY